MEIRKEIDKQEFKIDKFGRLAKANILIGGKDVSVGPAVVPNLNLSYDFESGSEEFFFNVNRKEGKGSQGTLSENKLKIKSDKESDEWEPITDDILKWYIAFDEDPRKDAGDLIVDFELSYNKGVYILPIRDITEQEILEGASPNPENVTNSFAVYCDKHSNSSKGKYYSGKMLHIYRRKWINADNSETWVTQELLNVSKTKATLRVKVPKEVMDNATYPAILNDTFGVTSYGSNSSSSSTPGDGAYLYYIGQAPEDGILTAVVISDNDTTSTNGYALFYIGSSEGTQPDFVAMSSEQSWASDGDHSSPVSDSFSSGDYLYTGIQHDTSSSMKVYYDAVSWYYDYTTTDSTYGSPPQPTWSSPLSTTKKFTTWIEYTTGGTDYEIETEPSSYVLSGLSVSLLANRSINSASSSYSITGISTELLRNILLSLETNSYSITGADLLFIRDYILNSESGSMSINGISTELLRNMLLSLETNSYSITGADLLFIKDYTLNSELGSLTMTGSDLTQIYDRIINGAPSTYNLSGISTSVLKELLCNLSPSSYLLSGIESNILANRLISQDVGSYLVTGISSELMKEIIVILDPAVYSYSGIAVELLKNYVLGGNVGSYIITGFSISHAGDVTLILEPTSYTLNSFDLNFLYNKVLKVDSSTYVYTGVTNSLLFNRNLNSANGIYTITGLNTEYLYNRAFQADPSSYLVTGQTAQILYNKLLNLEPISYNITGNLITTLRNLILSGSIGTYEINGIQVTLDLDVDAEGMIRVIFSGLIPGVSFSGKRIEVLFDT